MKALTELNDRDFDMTVNGATTPVVVEFYAPWCGLCKMLTPLLDSLAEHFAGRIQFFKVNVDEAQELANRFRVIGVPMLRQRLGELDRSRPGRDGVCLRQDRVFCRAHFDPRTPAKLPAP